MRCRSAAAALLVLANAARVHGQDPLAAAVEHQKPAGQAPVPAAPRGSVAPAEPAGNRQWTWSTDANVFLGYNHQRRPFADFSAWESQNWFMLGAEHQLGPGRLMLTGMLSLEPMTIGKLVYAGDSNPQRIQAGGSPQLYQTGESYRREPLVNYQHPHDLIMGLGATFRIARPRATYRFTAALVGSPALGPTPFMHRESARNNPQAPLTHHALDSTHVTPGVLTAGIEAGPLSFETSVFRGSEPDEKRFTFDRPRLDSWSARVGWRRGPWQAQVSGGHLHEPEWFEPWDVTKVTGSIEFDGTVVSRPLRTTAAWGKIVENNGFNDAADSYLFEWDLQAARPSSIYGRAEQARKQLFGLGFHPKGLNHRHTYSDITALTIGYLHDLTGDWWGRIGIGADITAYRTSPDLFMFYGSSRSYHAFLRWRPARAAGAHVH
jgi:hypothetical protein